MTNRQRQSETETDRQTETETERETERETVSQSISQTGQTDKKPSAYGIKCFGPCKFFL